MRVCARACVYRAGEGRGWRAEGFLRSAVMRGGGGQGPVGSNERGGGCVAANSIRVGPCVGREGKRGEALIWWQTDGVALREEASGCSLIPQAGLDRMNWRRGLDEGRLWMPLERGRSFACAWRMSHPPSVATNSAGPSNTPSPTKLYKQLSCFPFRVPC